MHLFLRAIFVYHCLREALSIRKVSAPFLNPDCPSDEIDCSRFNLSNYPDSANNLIYAFSDNAHDRIHVLISTINGLSVFLVKADLNSSLDIEWPEFLAKNYSQPSIHVYGDQVKSQFGFSVFKLYRYEDISDAVDVEKSDKVESIDMSGVLWSNVTINEQLNVVTFRTSNETSNRNVFGSDGILELSFQIFDMEGYFDLMPRLLHNDQSAQIEISLSGLSPFSYNRTRYALELVVISNNSTAENSINQIRLDDIITMNDENTPGIFDTLILQDSLDCSYLLWKPVCYYNANRGLTSLSRVYAGQLKTYQNHSIGGLIGAYYGHDLWDHQIRRLNISFGLSEDKFYPGYLIWTLQVGLGKPPSEGFSSLIIGLFIVCLATPCGALFTGGWYGFYSRKRRDDLLITEDT